MSHQAALELDGGPTEYRVTARKHWDQAVDQLLASEAYNYKSTPTYHEVFWPLTDHQGTVREIYSSSTSGDVLQRTEYDAFGRPDLVHTVSVAKWYVDSFHAGREYDEITGLYYNRARWYDPESRRFISEDPLGFGGGDANLYRYVGNSPTNATDPSGQIISGAVGAALIIGTLIEGIGRSFANHSIEHYDAMANLNAKAAWTADDAAQYEEHAKSASFYHGWGETLGMSGVLVAASPLAAPLYGWGSSGMAALHAGPGLQVAGGLVTAGVGEKVAADSLLYSTGLDSGALSRYVTNPGRTAFEFGASTLFAGLGNFGGVTRTLAGSTRGSWSHAAYRGILKSEAAGRFYPKAFARQMRATSWAHDARICFVAGTPVVVGAAPPEGGAPEVALAATGENRFNTYYALSAGAFLAAGWMAAEVREEKRRRKERQLHEAADSVFDHFDDDPDPPDPDVVDEEADDLYLSLAAQDRFDDARLEAAADAYCEQVGPHDPTGPERVGCVSMHRALPAQWATRSELSTVGNDCEDRRVTATKDRRSEDIAARRRPQRSALRGTAIAFLLAVSALFGLKGYLGSTSADPSQAQLTVASAQTPTLDTIPIEQIRVGQRVLTGEAEPDKTLPTAVDEQTWRHLTFEATDTWPDGTVDRVEVEALQPPEWLALHDGAPVGLTVPIPLDLEEMGLPEGMTARVTSNEPCPVIDQGSGRVVLTTVNHLNPSVVELTIQSSDGAREATRPTTHHKFYSETRERWLSAEDLNPGETLRGLDGPLHVVSIRPVPGVHRVYNMTVEGEHVYHVSTLGVLAHNNGCTQAKTRRVYRVEALDNTRSGNTRIAVDAAGSVGISSTKSGRGLNHLNVFLDEDEALAYLVKKQLKHKDSVIKSFAIPEADYRRIVREAVDWDQLYGLNRSRVIQRVDVGSRRHAYQFPPARVSDLLDMAIQGTGKIH